MLDPHLPNFLIVGAPKCGTTSLVSYLSQHPDIFIPNDNPHISPPKTETNFFVQDRTLIGIGPGNMRYNTKYISTSDYVQLFCDVKSERSIGEASPSYLYFHEHTIPNIKSFLGDVKIIILIRDPVARAYSSHLHHRRNNNEIYSFEQALLLEERREEQGCFYGCQLRKVGRYYAQVSAFMESFTNVLVLRAENLRGATLEQLSRVFSFLGVDPAFRPKLIEPHNVGRVYRSWPIERKLRRFEATTVARKILGTRSIISLARKLNSFKPRINIATAAILADYFKEDVRMTGELIGHDLRFWLNQYEF
jgi:hypothetical protein